jgi:hypothetical protein
MLPYFLLFAFFAVGALFSRQHAVAGDIPAGEADVPPSRTSMLLVGGLLIALFIGLRFEVGGDWDAYVIFWKFAGLVDLHRVLALGDPGYQFLNWLAQQAGLGVWAVNLACGLLFSWGLIRFARTQPFPWLTVVVAIPYLVIVVAMGYSRQAVAIGLLMAGFAPLFRGGSLLRFVVYAILATTFHKTAVLAIPLVIFSIERNQFLTLIGGAALIAGLYTAFLAEDVDMLVKNYVEAEYQSSGAAIRVALSLLPAALFLLFRKRLQFNSVQERFWLLSSYGALGLLAALLLTPSTTAVDRMALYLFPLQLAVLGRLPFLVREGSAKLLVIAYALLIQFVWLNYAVHAKKWLPYQSFLF